MPSESRSLWLPGKPLPKPRPSRGTHGKYYTPDTGWEEELAVAWMQKHGREPLEGPVEVTMVFVLGKQPGLMVTVEPAGNWGNWHQGRVDIDNLAKATLDGLNKMAWNDDNQVVVLQAQKVTGLAGADAQKENSDG